MSDADLVVALIMDAGSRSPPTTPPKERKKQLPMRANRVSSIIKQNKRMIGKSINTPSEPGYRRYDKVKPSYAPPTFTASLYSKFYSRRGVARNLMPLKNQELSGVDCEAVDVSMKYRRTSPTSPTSS